eukprot:Skav200778  [mRNA]  locus=scaffold2001:527731:531888:- [translate_table: standard]
MMQKELPSAAQSQVRKLRGSSSSRIASYGASPGNVELLYLDKRRKLSSSSPSSLRLRSNRTRHMRTCKEWLGWNCWLSGMIVQVGR